MEMWLVGECSACESRLYAPHSQRALGYSSTGRLNDGAFVSFIRFFKTDYRGTGDAKPLRMQCPFDRNMAQGLTTGTVGTVPVRTLHHGSTTDPNRNALYRCS